MKSRKKIHVPLCKQCSFKIIFGDIFCFEPWAEDHHAMPLCAIYFILLFSFSTSAHIRYAQEEWRKVMESE